MRNNIVGAGFNVGANALVITFVGITAAAGVRVATYAIMLVPQPPHVREPRAGAVALVRLHRSGSAGRHAESGPSHDA